MDITQAYATAIGGFFFVCALPELARLVKLASFLISRGLAQLVKLASFLISKRLAQLVERVSLLTSKHLSYRYLIHRHRFIGPWTRADLVIQLIYTVANAFCVRFRAPTISEAGLRAGTLSLINAIPLFAGPHFSFLADWLSVSLSTYRCIHRSAGFMSSALLLFHVLVTVTSGVSFALDQPRNRFTFIGGSSLGLLLFLSYPLFRKPSYELFLRAHQALAALFAYGVWQHLPTDKSFPRFYLYLSAGVFLGMLVIECGSILWKNGILRYTASRAHITHASGTVKVRISCQQPLKIKTGQHINLWLWIPSVSFWSFLQCHPFVVISWADGPQDTLDLFIEPRRGLTQRLLYHALHHRARKPLVLVGGPHGSSVPMYDYENVVMVASGFGIAAYLPYLKQLIHGYNVPKVRTRRVHLVWQIRDIEVGIAAQPLLNDFLDEDRLDRGYILHISIYLESNYASDGDFGKRAQAYPGAAPLEDILKAEVKEISEDNAGEGKEEKDGKMLPKDEDDDDAKTLVEGETEKVETEGNGSKMLITVSGSEEIRDRLRILVRDYLDKNVRLLELDYQPSEK